MFKSGYSRTLASHLSNPPASGNAMTLRPRRTFTRSLNNWLSPPVASQRNSGKAAEQMTAVFSASASATGNAW